MVGQPLRLGPFIGGLNTVSDATAIADAELVDLTNLELDIDGSLISRTPLIEVNGHSTWTERIIMIGSGTFSGVTYLFGSNTNGVYRFSAGAWVLITSTFKASVAIQYNNKMWFVPAIGHTGLGGNWDPTAGFVVDADIPVGSAAIIHKERLFIVPGIDATTNGSRVKFSNVADFGTWSASDFFDIMPGDGANVIDITVYQDNILLFKAHSTFVFAYDVRPADAVVRHISLTIGVDRQHTMVNYENQVYIFHENWVYEIINYDFHRLNTKVPFVRDETAPTPFSEEAIHLSLLEDRLICRFFNRIYVYGLRTRTWSEWSANKNVLHYFGPIVTLHPSGEEHEYYAGSALLDNRTVIQLFDERTASNKESSLDPDVTNFNDTFTRTSSDGWGTANSGQTWSTSGGTSTDYTVDGSKGIVSIGAVNSNRHTLIASYSQQDVDIRAVVESSVVATGAAIAGGITCRVVDLSNHYVAKVAFKTTGQANVELGKVVAGVFTTLANADIGTYVANEQFNLRVRIEGTSLKAKLWKIAALEPLNWTITTTDSAFTAAGAIGTRNRLDTGNTNTLPVVVRYDNIRSFVLSSTGGDIPCRAKTKNFDMAISHQFKRLWWWGADVTTNRNATGTATPIILSFSVTWDQLASVSWDALQTWDQPLTTLSSVVTVVATGTGTARRFIKFLKGLRYRQINFQVDLITDGSTVDGPARIFTFTIITESKQRVPKAIN